MKLLELLLSVCALLTATSALADRDSLLKLSENRQFRVPERCVAIVDVKTPREEIGKKLYRVMRHPKLDSLMIRNPEKEREILAEINRRCDALGKDSLLTSDLFWVMRPYFDYLHYQDPHYRIAIPGFVDRSYFKKASEVRKMEKQLKIPAFNLLNINDTLIIDRSLDPQFRKGDRVTAINGIPADEYLKYCYADRHTDPITLMQRLYYGSLVDSFHFDLIRGGQAIKVATQGFPSRDTEFRLLKAEEIDLNIRTYADANCGYIAIPEFFFNNNRLIRIIREAIVNFKKQGITNVILDLRRNPGGNGHAFDKLLSIFIDKAEVQYCTAQRLKVSTPTLGDHEFLTKEMLGQTVELPEGAFVRSFKTDPKMYVPGMKYYVLTGRDTGSIAASLVNILQYNDAALLAGEPLLHNALTYGETIDGAIRLPTQLQETGISTIEIDECTRAVDGVVMPDVAIPAIAAEYLGGGDGVLDRLLGIIRQKE